MLYKYNLPDTNNNPTEHETDNNSIIIIGANGSGKSKLGAWMEMKNQNNIHRVSAQRSLNFNEYITLKSMEQAEKQLFLGHETAKQGTKLSYRWSSNKMTNTLLSDYEYVLSILVAKNNLQENAFVNQCKLCETKGTVYPKVPSTVIDAFKEIWREVFPQRDITFRDSKVMAIFNKISGEGEDQKTESIKYKGIEMSDGERVALYLIAQCLCLPDNITIIVDEPEIHLHRSIMNKLWSAVEKKRNDCLFIYITHDTQFAANHKQAKKIWVKSFDGRLWDIKEVKESSLPEELLLNILGNRKPVIFVEGNADSYDTKLYSLLYTDYYVIPCGSCSNVILQTKAMKNNEQLHHLKCYGIIDRDFRSDYELNKYKENNIYSLKVAEVENLFLVEELLTVVNEIMGNTNNVTAINNVKNYIIEDRYKKQREKQIVKAIVTELKHRLSTAEISSANETGAVDSLATLYSSISYLDIKTEKEEVYKDEIEYKEVLTIFNEKSLSTSIGQFYDLANNKYCDFVLKQFSTKYSSKIKSAIIPYLPDEITI